MEEGSGRIRDIVVNYAHLNKQLTEENRRIKDLKTQKDSLGEVLLSYMQANQLDEAALPSGEKVVKKISRRTSTLKKEYILEELMVIYQGDEAKAQQSLQSIMSKRDVTEKEVISLVIPK